jgi:serine/threonine-protein kinase 11
MNQLLAASQAPPLFRPILQEPKSPSSRPRKKVNEYCMVAKIGCGSSAQVFLAIREPDCQRFALKRFRLHELARQDGGIDQLEREIRLIRRFSHPNILRLFSVLHNQTGGEVYLVLEYADQGSLQRFIARGETLPSFVVFSVIKQIAGALKYIHAMGYVHHDIKPSNILLDARGRALLSDFGIGHTFHSAEMVFGSPAFQAPEALNDEYEEQEVVESGAQKEDIWALGVTLYQSLFLKLPFTGADVYQINREIKTHGLEIPAGARPDVVELLNGMLSVDPAKRLGLDDLLAHPLVRDAPDRVENLPEVPIQDERAGDIVQASAIVCPEGYSLAAAQPRGLLRSYKVGTYPRTLARTKAYGNDDMPASPRSYESLCNDD